ncbi:MAG: DUF2127 domain-containing protein [Deltaproteobacteria bacterium]|nr:DUF2127 domain-containing protein [Deltaproteobacteria bacterium]
MPSPTAVNFASPFALDNRASIAGLRAVASFEALKGIVVLGLGIALLILHQHVEAYAENLLFHLHINMDRRLGHAVLHAASQISDARLLTLALAITIYPTVRFIEAWGLWNRRVWAEWFALLSGAMYLPWELLKLAEKPNWTHGAILAVNVVVVAYMLWIRVRECGWLLRCREHRAVRRLGSIRAGKT